MRDLTSGMQAAIADKVVYPILFAFFDFESAPVRFWTGYGPFTWGGNTYVGSGDLGSIGEVEETTEIAAKGVTFTLSGIPTSLLALSLLDNYQNRACKLWLGACTADGTLIADPYMIFAGRMDVINMEEGGEMSNVTITAENRLVDLHRSRERRYTDADQRIDFADDEAFKFVNALQEKSILWGQAYSPTANNTDNGGDSYNGYDQN
jgi:hypothetical protein